MARISDPVLAAIAGGYSTEGLPMTTARAIYRTTRLLLAACSLADVGVFAQPNPVSDGRYQVTVIGKFAISFTLPADAAGPTDLVLEKLGKHGKKE